VTAIPALRLVKTVGDWTFDPVTRRYRYRSGRAVSPARVRSAFEARQNSTAKHMDKLARQLAQGKLTPAGYEEAMRRAIKMGYIQGAILGGGGRERVTKGDWGAIGNQLRSEYGHLRKLVAEAGDLSEGRLAQRSKYYAGANMGNARISVSIRSARRDGHNEKRRFGPGDGHSCTTCLDEIAMGWVPIDDPGFLLGHRGGTECGSNDRCDIETRRNTDEEAE